MASGFEKAFAAARKEKGANGTFTYGGKTYSTKRADDETPTPPRRPKDLSSGRTQMPPVDVGFKSNDYTPDEIKGKKAATDADSAKDKEYKSGWADPGTMKYKRGGKVQSTGSKRFYPKKGC